MATLTASSRELATLGFCGSTTARQGCEAMESATAFCCRSGPSSLGRSYSRVEIRAPIRTGSKGLAPRVVVMSYADPSMGSVTSGGVEPQFVPRICTLKEFSEDGAESLEFTYANTGIKGIVVEEDRSLIGLLAATIEATAQVADFETLSGRLAMIGFAIAVSSELITGHGVFSDIDIDGLLRILGLCFVSALAAGSFAAVFKAKANASDIIASGCKRLVDGAVDSVIDGVFFQEDEAVLSKRE